MITRPARPTTKVCTGSWLDQGLGRADLPCRECGEARPETIVTRASPSMNRTIAGASDGARRDEVGLEAGHGAADVRGRVDRDRRAERPDVAADGASRHRSLTEPPVTKTDSTAAPSRTA